MDDDILSLGTAVAPWTIKDFSVALRGHVTKAARQADCTMADWMHGYFQRHGIDGQQFAPVKLNHVEPAQGNGSSSASIADLCAIAEAAARVAETRDTMPKGLSAKLSRRLKEALLTPEEAARPPRSRQRAIAAPEEDKGA